MIDKLLALVGLQRIKPVRESNYEKHFLRECKILGWLDGEDDMQSLVIENVVDLLRVFSEQGHSGSSAPYVMNLFKRASMFKPLSPLTGAPEEWQEVGDGCYQNLRCSAVFKNGEDGAPYWLYGKVFQDPSGCTYTSGDSCVDIEFPWEEPEQSEIVYVCEHGKGLTDYCEPCGRVHSA